MNHLKVVLRERRTHRRLYSLSVFPTLFSTSPVLFAAPPLLLCMMGNVFGFFSLSLKAVTCDVTWGVTQWQWQGENHCLSCQARGYETYDGVKHTVHGSLRFTTRPIYFCWSRPGPAPRGAARSLRCFTLNLSSFVPHIFTSPCRKWKPCQCLLENNKPLMIIMWQLIDPGQKTSFSLVAHSCMKDSWRLGTGFMAALHELVQTEAGTLTLRCQSKEPPHRPPSLPPTTTTHMEHFQFINTSNIFLTKKWSQRSSKIISSANV